MHDFAICAVKHDALAAFLDAHVGVAHNDDIGPLIGQASVMRNARVEALDHEAWARAVSAAVADVPARH